MSVWIIIAPRTAIVEIPDEYKHITLNSIQSFSRNDERTMSVVKQWLCAHEFEPMSLRKDDDTLFKKCRKCGRRIEESLGGESASTA